MSDLEIPIEKRILVIRGHRVLIDADLAELYGVTTRRLNEQVKRNKERFPEAFAFQLNHEDKAEVVANCDHLNKIRFSSALPYAFTEHGVVMAASVLNSPRAIEMSIYVVKKFIKIKEAMLVHNKFAQKLSELELKVEVHDEAITSLFEALRELLEPVLPEERKKIGLK